MKIRYEYQIEGQPSKEAVLEEVDRLLEKDGWDKNDEKVEVSIRCRPEVSYAGGCIYEYEAGITIWE